jgi:peptide-methionine (S)-S-oxide reductase
MQKSCLVEFDEDLISYELLVDEFWKCHDPTTLDRQGPDVGRQYRSVIYYYNDMQKNIANKSKERHQESFQNNIVTEISRADIFYKAEEYHQKYILKGNSCAI